MKNSYIWKVLKSKKRYEDNYTKHKLCRGDIIKLGRYIYEIKEISSVLEMKQSSKLLNLSVDNTEIEYKQSLKENRPSIIPRSNTINTNMEYNTFENEQLHRSNEPSKGLPAHESMSQKSKGEMLCRICLSEDSSDENPLISPCKCSGTMKYIHLACLKEWLSSKRSDKIGVYFSSFLWENVFCELCKENFTENVETQFGVVNILGIEVPK